MLNHHLSAWRSAWIVGALVCVVALVGLGCGGGGSKSSSTGTSGVGPSSGGSPVGPVGQPIGSKFATGTVVLPAGAKITLSTCTVASAFDTEKVGANGAFKLAVPGSGPVPVHLNDAKGDLLMVGYVDSGAGGTSPYTGGNGRIDATQTAIFLLYTAVDGFLAPSEVFEDVLVDVSKASQLPGLASVVAGRIAANPLAVQSDDAQISSAVQSAASTIAAAGASAAAAQAKPSQSPGVFRLTVTKPATDGGGSGYGLILDPSGAEQAGMNVLNTGSTGQPGISFQNTIRRRAAAFIYETAVAMPGGSLQPVTPVPVSTQLPGLISLMYPIVGGTKPLVLPYEIQPSNALHGTFGSLIDLYVYQAGAYSPVTTGPVSLTVTSGATKTEYTIVVVGDGFDNFDKLPSSLNSLKPYVGDWENTVTALRLETAALDELIPVFFSMVWPEGVEELKNVSVDVRNSVVQDAANALAGGPDFLNSEKNGDKKGAQNALVQTFFDSGSWRDALTAKMVTSLYKTSVPEVNQTIESVEAGLNSYTEIIGIVDFILQEFDSAQVTLAGFYGDKVESWTADVSAVTGCGAVPPPINAGTLSTPNHPGVVVSMNKGAYYGGQSGTVTFTIQAGNPDEEQWTVGFSGPIGPTGVGAPIKVTAIDGKPLGNTGLGGLVQHPGQAETHTVSFTMGQPVAYYQGPDEAFCTGGFVGNVIGVPNVMVQVFDTDGDGNIWGTAFFDELPAENPASLADRVDAEMGAR